MFLAVDVFRPSGALQYGGVSKVYINVALKLSCLAYLILYQDFKIDQFWCKFWKFHCAEGSPRDEACLQLEVWRSDVGTWGLFRQLWGGGSGGRVVPAEGELFSMDLALGNKLVSCVFLCTWHLGRSDDLDYNIAYVPGWYGF